MTNIATYPLIMFYRLRKYSPHSSGIFAGYPEAPPSTWQTTRLALLESYAAARPDLFQMVTDGRHRETHLIFDTEATLPTLDELAGELAADWDRVLPQKEAAGPATLELLVTCLVKGDQHGTYGNSYWSQENETIHLLSCGFDWAEFRGVGMGRWSEWGGTFGEDTWSDVLEARMTCRCDDEEEVAFGMELPSLADLIVTLDSKQLQRLFEDR